MVVTRFALVTLLVASLAQRAAGDALDRLAPERLRATHQQVESLKQQLRPVTLRSGFDDYRAALHVHSSLSPDSRGTLDEIVEGAKAAGVRVVMFTEHPVRGHDYVTEGHHGLKDGVLLIPGVETEGFLAYPRSSMKEATYQTPQQFADLVRDTGGLVFLCHLEERLDWEIAGLTGTEIYNTHADLKDEIKLLNVLRVPTALLTLSVAVKQYPQETFAALQDYPADYINRWDHFCQRAPHTGVSANDAHHNRHYRLYLDPDGKLKLEDGFNQKLGAVDPQTVPMFKAIAQGKPSGYTLFEIDLDPYERSFRHVSTHLLMHELTEVSVWEALQAGRAYVAFDWMADPTGFTFRADRGADRWPMGAEVPSADGLRLRAEAPLPGTIKLLRNGQLVESRASNALDVSVIEAGNYRVEVWLTLAGEPRPWILSNPIYVRAAPSSRVDAQ